MYELKYKCRDVGVVFIKYFKNQQELSRFMFRGHKESIEILSIKQIYNESRTDNGSTLWSKE